MTTSTASLPAIYFLRLEIGKQTFPDNHSRELCGFCRATPSRKSVDLQETIVPSRLTPILVVVILHTIADSRFQFQIAFLPVVQSSIDNPQSAILSPSRNSHYPLIGMSNMAQIHVQIVVPT
jgi:hypothetical protein